MIQLIQILPVHIFSFRYDQCEKTILREVKKSKNESHFQHSVDV